jgi:hypothetical protein
MDNAWSVVRKRKGFYLYGSELGQVAGPCKTISEALTWGLNQYGGSRAKIETNIPLEELFDLMNTNSFEPFLHNLEHLELNGVEINVESFKDFVTWHAQMDKPGSERLTNR